jgi:PIN domain nuclease of toxin-antitoxin system
LKLLLDTRAALWSLSGDDRLGANAKRHLIDDANRVLLSAAVVCEVAIKRSLDKLVVPDGYLSLLRHAYLVAIPLGRFGVVFFLVPWR